MRNTDPSELKYPVVLKNMHGMIVVALGVGEDVILSEMVVSVMSITGVEAITFNDPDPSTERIAIADNEKAFIIPDDISVS